jgi:hypothetical protein
MAHADWIIDLGPEGGSKGGRAVFVGTPRALLDHAKSLTSRYLQRSTPAVDAQGGAAKRCSYGRNAPTTR